MDTNSTPSAGAPGSWPRVLLFAYYFPPQGGAGVQRPAKTVQHWIRRGVSVAVLRGPVDPDFCDPSLSEGIPDEVCERASDPSPMGVLQRLRPTAPARGVRHALDRCLVALSVMSGALSVPDACNGWLITAVWRGLGMTRRFRPDVIVATGPPFTAFLAAGIVSRIRGIPLVLDYRDPWSATYLKTQQTRLRRLLNPSMERWALGKARGVVAAHRSVFDCLRKAGPGFLRRGQRRMWVPNGYDPHDFNAEPREPGKQFVLAYTGHFYAFRNPRVLLEVLEDLLETGVIDPQRFRFRLAGELKQVQSICKPGPQLSRVLHMEGYRSHPESVRSLQESTVNLVLEGTSGGRNMHSPGKVFEVLYARRPVLLICPEGTTPRLARRAGGCLINDPADRDGIRDSVSKLYRDWAEGRSLPVPNPANIRFYERGLQADRMLRFLSSLAPACAAAGPSNAASSAGPPKAATTTGPPQVHSRG